MHLRKISLSTSSMTAIAALVVPFAAPSAAFAQDAAVEAAGSEYDGGIVVTAQRREEKLQEVPLAITAVSGDSLANHGTTDLRGISQAAPSLNIAVYPNSSDTVSLTMRGQGVADAGQITKDGGVGLYVDGFYISRPQAALLDLGDPERIEVLRGPQGTLYGRNTTGGAVNIISKKPTGEFGGDVSLTYGSRDYVRGLINLDLPMIGDQLAIKGTFLYSDQDGYVKNHGQPHDYHESGQVAGRVAVRWTPTDMLTVDYAFDRGRVVSTQPYYINPDLEGLGGPFTGYVFDKENTYAPLDIDQSRAHFTDHQLTVNIDVSDNLTIRSLSSYRKSRAFQDINYGLGQSFPIAIDPFPFPPPAAYYGDLFVQQQHNYRNKQYTQELQLIGSIGDYVEYTGGLYYFKETGSHHQEQQIAGSSFFLPFTFLASSRNVAAKSISKAAYLQTTITAPMEERLKLTLGARYTDDKRNATRNLAFFGFPTEVDAANRQNFDNFSPSINLAMQWSPDFMTYARFSKGYKAGGSAESALDFATATYGPEKVEAWEVGFKSQFLDRVVTLNTSFFYNKFRNMQLDFGVDPIDLTQVATENAGRAEIKGAEVELDIRPVPSAGLRVTYAYLDPTLKQVEAPAGTLFDPALNAFSPVAVGDDVTGFFTLPFIPKNSLTVSGDWTILDNGGPSLTAYASFMYQGSMYTSSVAGPDVFGRELWKSQPRKVVNGRLVWDQPLDSMDVSIAFFVNNLFDRRAREFVIGVGQQVPNSPNPAGYISQTAPYSEPRVFGIEVKADF